MNKKFVPVAAFGLFGIVIVALVSCAASVQTPTQPSPGPGNPVSSPCGTSCCSMSFRNGSTGYTVPPTNPPYTKCFPIIQVAGTNLATSAYEVLVYDTYKSSTTQYCARSDASGKKFFSVTNAHVFRFTAYFKCPGCPPKGTAVGLSLEWGY